MEYKNEQELVNIARRAITAHLTGEDIKKPQHSDFNQTAGVFVTLRVGGTLRGCIGQMHSEKPLEITIADNAVAAATRDPRFYPVKHTELHSINIEVSILSPLEPVDDPLKIVIGKHGLMIEKNGQRGVLLPEVAQDNGWDILTFLNQLCLKAGLPPGSWKDAALFRFTSHKIIENPKFELQNNKEVNT